MPKGKYTNHKGRNRFFTNPEELEEQRRKEEQEKKWRKNRGDESSESEEEVEDNKDSSGSSSDESDSDSGTEKKAKGVSNLIEIENPNRVQKKSKKLSTLNKELATHDVAKPSLSRREREEVEKQQAAAHYQKMHAEGKTEEARADLARLAIIKQQREEAARRREIEKKQREDAVKAKSQQTQKALGKKT